MPKPRKYALIVLIGLYGSCKLSTLHSKGAGVHIIAVGYGRGIDNNTLEEMAGVNGCFTTVSELPNFLAVSQCGK